MLIQPDGSTFWARQVGDEWANGMETLDGYFILRDPATSYWTYADSVPGVGISPSALIVGSHVPAGIAKGLRPPRAAPVAAPEADSLTSAALLAPAPALGSRSILTLFVDFTPSARVGATPSSLNTSLFGSTGSAKKYYEETSYGAFTLKPAVESDVALGGGANDGVVAVTLPYAHPNTAGATDDRNRRIVRDALLAADAFVDFAGYDTNGDGVISAAELNILVVVAGYETAYSSTCGPSVWAHQWNLFGAVPTVALDGKTVGGTYTQIGEWHCSTSAPPGHQATIGIIAHELGHDLGLPDLYDTDQSSEGIGNWGLMAGGSWNRVSASGDSPAHMDPWSKFFLGWITPTRVTGTLTNETISPAATTADVYQFLTGTPISGEYFLVENRQRVGFDAGLPGQGLLIWHIDTAKTTSDNTDNTQECYPGGPSCATYHYKVAVIQADNLYELEKNIDRGDGGDPWPGTSGKTSFNDASTPNSRLYSGASSGVSITGITVVGTNITATLGPPTSPLTVSLTADPPPPTQPLGTTITFTATAANGVAPHQYKWWVFNGTTWTVERDWAVGNNTPTPGSDTSTWKPATAGNYFIQVWVRNSGTTANAPDAYRNLAYTITPPSPLSLALTAAPPSPQAVGTTITFTATATGGVAPHQYKWWVFNGTTWSIGQPWSASTSAPATFTWTPPVGSYTIQVWVRNSGTTADAPDAYRNLAYTVTPPSPLSVTSLTAAPPSPQAVGTMITFTATATGGVAPHQYKWWVFNGTTWSMRQTWGASTFVWTPPAPGSYTIQVWARNNGTTTDTPEAYRQLDTAYNVTGTALTVTNLTADKVSPQVAGTPITLTATALGGVAPYEYKWWIAKDGAWTVGQPWSTANTFVWTPTAAGNYTIQVWARNSGTTTDTPEAYGQVAYTATVLTVTSLTADRPSPSAARDVHQLHGDRHGRRRPLPV